MARRQSTFKIAPRSGRFILGTTIGAQKTDQSYRIYNTGTTDLEIQGIAVPATVQTNCSIDIGVPPSTAFTISGPNEESAGVYELLPSEGIRSGQFKLPEAAKNTIIMQGKSDGLYRFFNTGKDSVVLSIDTSSYTVNVGGSLDLFVPKSKTVMVTAPKSIGVYDWLAGNAVGSKFEIDSTIRDGHFEQAGKLIDISKAPAGIFIPVYRLFNSGKHPIKVTFGTAFETVNPKVSIDFQVPKVGSDAGLVKVEASDPVSGEVQGAFDLLKIN